MWVAFTYQSAVVPLRNRRVGTLARLYGYYYTFRGSVDNVQERKNIFSGALSIGLRSSTIYAKRNMISITPKH